LKRIIFADIHANLEALEAIIATAAQLRIDEYWCLGDVVGYYADPEACVRKLRELGVVCLQGNHDAVASGVEEPIDFNPMAADMIRWTARNLSPESRQWLAQLPWQSKITEGIFAVHGSLRSRDEYLLFKPVIEENFELMNGSDRAGVVFFGHTHRRIMYIHNGREIQEAGSAVLSQVGKFNLLRENRYLINPGGAGQPRDGAIGAPYLVLEEEMVYFGLAEYDWRKTAAKLGDLPYGDLLAERLRRGV